MDLKKFAVGDLVVWTSSSAGVPKTKTGKVEAVISPGRYPTPEQCKEADAHGICRQHESYLVRVPGKTQKAKGKLYWPRVISLNKAQLPDEMQRLSRPGTVD